MNIRSRFLRTKTSDGGGGEEEGSASPHRGYQPMRRVSPSGTAFAASQFSQRSYGSQHQAAAAAAGEKLELLLLPGWCASSGERPGEVESSIDYAQTSELPSIQP